MSPLAATAVTEELTVFVRSRSVSVRVPEAARPPASVSVTEPAAELPPPTVITGASLVPVIVMVTSFTAAELNSPLAA